MTFTTFIKTLEQLFACGQLPGKWAHAIMRPSYATLINPAEELKQAAVMVLFFPKSDVPHFVLIKRTDVQNHPHSKQISFPGGKFDDVYDKDLCQTALRETTEEIGVSANDVSVVGTLSDIIVPVSSHVVTPFVGTVNYYPVWNRNQLEVEYIIEVAFDKLFESNIRCTETIQWNGTDHIVPYFDIYGERVWGATAMILSELIEFFRTGF